MRTEGHNRPVAILLTTICVLLSATQPGSKPVEASELAEYRLTAPVLTRFAHASRLIATATRNRPALQETPLFSREITVSGDAADAAAALQARLDAEPAFATALFAADLDSREYVKFALALFAARLAHGFVKSGAIRRVPAGAAADNIAFIEQNEVAVRGLLRMLELER